MSGPEDLFAYRCYTNRDHPNDILKLIQSEIDVNKQGLVKGGPRDGDRSVGGTPRDNALGSSMLGGCQPWKRRGSKTRGPLMCTRVWGRNAARDDALARRR